MQSLLSIYPFSGKFKVIKKTISINNYYWAKTTARQCGYSSSESDTLHSTGKAAFSFSRPINLWKTLPNIPFENRTSY